MVVPAAAVLEARNSAEVVPQPCPAVRKSVGGRPGGPGSGPGNRPAGGGIGNRPGIDNRPGGVGGIGNRPGIDNRPGGVGGIGNRPGIDNRPGGVGGIGNRPGIDNRPGGVGGIGNRPGIDNRPGGIGGIGNRPGIDNRPGGVGGIGNRPGIDNRPGGIGGIGNRPGIDNRPIIGSGNTINRGDVNVGGIRQNNLAGIGVDPGYGVRPPAYNNWRGAYWGYHQGWANGYWHGYHDNNNWGWGSFATGAAAGVTAWALGSSFYNWGYASYANPYYAEAAMAQPIVIEQTVVGGEPQTVTVPAYTYDYSQPIDTQSAPPPAEVADPAIAKFDSARAAFGSGDYAGALRLTDEALKVLPNDATLHEFRALVLFAVGKYDLAAGPLYAVLSVGPGWDWTTMAGLYPDIDVYTASSASSRRSSPRIRIDGRSLRPGLSLPDSGPHRRGRESAQASCGLGAPGHALCSARQAVLAATEPDPQPAPSTATATGCHTRQAGESGWELDRPPGRRHDDRPAHRGRRDLHLEGHRQGQAQATRREMVAC